MMDSCSEQQNESIEPCLNKFWVDLDELGLGFASEKKRTMREERTASEERETMEKMRLNRAKSFYISGLDRVGPNPIQHPGDPDPLSHMGLGCLTVGFGFLSFFLEFVAMHTFILVI